MLKTSGTEAEAIKIHWSDNYWAMWFSKTFKMLKKAFYKTLFRLTKCFLPIKSPPYHISIMMAPPNFQAQVCSAHSHLDMITRCRTRWVALRWWHHMTGGEKEDRSIQIVFKLGIIDIITSFGPYQDGDANKIKLLPCWARPDFS